MACVTFDERFQSAVEAVKEVPLTQEEIRAREKHTPTKTVQAHDVPTLLAYLGLSENKPGDGSEPWAELSPRLLGAAAEWFQAGGLQT